MALVESYKQQGIELYKPNLRGHIEKQLKLITQGVRNWEEVLEEAILECRKIFNACLDN